MRFARAIASPNIALIKYWGNQGDPSLRLAANGSISMTLGGLTTEVVVTFEDSLEHDVLRLNGKVTEGPAAMRITKFLDVIRRISASSQFALVETNTDFPIGAGIASSAAAFAALALAASHAAGLRLQPPELSRLARLGSGSACRSVFGGFVEWLPGDSDETSVAQPLCPPDHWELEDLIAVIDEGHKPVGSTEGHAFASTSPLQPARVADAPRRLDLCRQAILQRDFAALVQVVEQDSNMMHAVMLTSTPPLVYWQPATVSVMGLVSRLRRAGVPVCYTIDAGPTVHCVCESTHAEEVSSALAEIGSVERVIRSRPGPGVRLIDEAAPPTGALGRPPRPQRDKGDKPG